MMNQMGLFNIGLIEELQAQILEMRYIKGRLSMFILLPANSDDNRKGLEEVKLDVNAFIKCFITDLWRELPTKEGW